MHSACINTAAKVTKVKQRRNRVSLVCFNCKEKKIKCNRESPCSSCIKAFTTATCTYTYFKNPKDNKFTIESIDEKKTPKLINLLNNEDSRSLVQPANTLVSSPEGTPLPLKFISSNSILYHKFNFNPEYIIFRKPSRTQVRPSAFAVYFNQNNIFSRNIILSFKTLLNNERKIWKAKNFNKSYQLIDINTSNSDTEAEMSKLNKLIEDAICNNYYSILERLTYFQNDLNKVLFNSYIPMGVVQLIFQHYFIMKSDSVIFRRPEKKFEYSFIALITSLVELTNIFTKHDKIEFNFPLTLKDNKFNDITVILINASNYRRKASVFNIYTLLNLRLTLMVYGDAQSNGIAGQNSYPIFQTVVHMCSELGINLDQNKVKFLDKLGMEGLNDKSAILLFSKEISANSYKLLWNYILTLDCYYSNNLCSPPLIDERYSHGYYPSLTSTYNHIDKFIKLTKELSLVILGSKPISLNDLFKNVQKIEDLFSKLGFFNDYLLFEKSEDHWQLIKLKFVLLKLLLTLVLHIRAVLSKENLETFFPKELLDDSSNKKAITLLKDDLTTKSKIIYFIGLTAILSLSQSNLSNKFLLYNREVFSNWLGIKSMLFMDIIASDDHEKRKLNKSVNNFCTDNKEKFELPPVPQFNIQDLENALINFTSEKNSATLSFVNEASQPCPLASFLTNVYESTIAIPILVTDYKFFVMTKIFLINIYFLYCYIKSNENKFEISANFHKLSDLSKTIFTKYLQEGTFSHIKTDQVMNDIEHAARKENDINSSLHQSPIRLKTNDDIAQESFNNLLTSINYDDLVLNFFEDNNLNDIYNDINQYFNPIEQMINN